MGSLPRTEGQLGDDARVSFADEGVLRQPAHEKRGRIRLGSEE
jgi:hypothetical protein